MFRAGTVTDRPAFAVSVGVSLLALVSLLLIGVGTSVPTAAG